MPGPVSDPSLTKENMSHTRSIICEVCGFSRRTQHWFDVCHGCLPKMSKKKCARCSGLFYRFAPNSDKCRPCDKKSSQEKVICHDCGAHDFPTDREAKRCRACNHKRAKKKYRQSLPKKVGCVECGLVRPSCKTSEMICPGCDKKRRCGGVTCSVANCNNLISTKRWLLCERHNLARRQKEWGLCTSTDCNNLVHNKGRLLCANHNLALLRNDCGLSCTFKDCNNLVHNKKLLLCRRHYVDRLMPGWLRRYIDTYSSPFSQNQRYFLKLVSTINWAEVDNGIRIIGQVEVGRFRAFGDFLKVQELPEKLTWQFIEETRARFNKKDWNGDFIRSCLLELGHVLAASGLLQDWNSYLIERCLLKSLNSVPEIFRDHVSSFQGWTQRGMPNSSLELPIESLALLSNTPASLLDTIRSVSAMLNWAVRQGIKALTEINTIFFSNYQDTLFWKHECGSCGKCVPFESHKNRPQCINCGATGSDAPVRRLSRRSTVVIISRLKVFFDWAYLHGFVASNPVQSIKGTSKAGALNLVDGRGKTVEVAKTIRRYNDTVLQKFFEYLVAVNAEPEEAVILYLVTFHLLTMNQLRNVKIPSLLNNTSSNSTSGDAENYQYLILPSTKPTRGNRSSKRPRKIKFLQEGSPWLIPLLERYYKKRNRLGKARHCEYLIATVSSARHNKPVSGTYVRTVLERASLHLLGGTVAISDLRQTAAAVISQRSKRRSAVLVPLGYSEKWATRFNYLEALPLTPRPPNVASPTTAGGTKPLVLPC